VHEFLKSVVS